MSDNRRMYRTIRQAIMRLYPGEPKGNTARILTTLAALVSGIVMGKSCQLPMIARQAPDGARPESRVKRYSRLSSIRELVFVMDGSEVGQGCIPLMISLQYGKRALPITWLVVRRFSWVTVSLMGSNCKRLFVKTRTS